MNQNNVNTNKKQIDLMNENLNSQCRKKQKTLVDTNNHFNNNKLVLQHNDMQQQQQPQQHMIYPHELKFIPSDNIYDELDDDEDDEDDEEDEEFLDDDLNTDESSKKSVKGKKCKLTNVKTINSNGTNAKTKKKKTKGRVKIKMEFIENKIRRYTTFSKRKTGIMKKAYELSTLTGTQVMLLVASETGHVYTFATKKLQPMITSDAGKNLIQACLSSNEDGGEVVGLATTTTTTTTTNSNNSITVNNPVNEFDNVDNSSNNREEDEFVNDEEADSQYQYLKAKSSDNNEPSLEQHADLVNTEVSVKNKFLVQNLKNENEYESSKKIANDNYQINNQLVNESNILKLPINSVNTNNELTTTTTTAITTTNTTTNTTINSHDTQIASTSASPSNNNNNNNIHYVSTKSSTSNNNNNTILTLPVVRSTSQNLILTHPLLNTLSHRENIIINLTNQQVSFDQNSFNSMDVAIGQHLIYPLNVQNFSNSNLIIQKTNKSLNSNNNVQLDKK